MAAICATSTKGSFHVMRRVRNAGSVESVDDLIILVSGGIRAMLKPVGLECSQKCPILSDWRTPEFNLDRPDAEQAVGGCGKAVSASSPLLSAKAAATAAAICRSEPRDFDGYSPTLHPRAQERARQPHGIVQERRPSGSTS